MADERDRAEELETQRQQELARADTVAIGDRPTREGHRTLLGRRR